MKKRTCSQYISAFLVLVMAASFMFMFAAKPCYACSCAGIPFDQEMNRSKAVFAGKVIQVNEEKSYHGTTGWFRPTYSLQKSILFEVTQTWKGISESQVIVYTGSGGGDCGFDFTLGNTYLVVAGGENELHTGICNRTKVLSTASAELSLLGQGQSPSVNVDLQQGSASWMGIYIVWLLAGVLVVGLFIFFLGRRMRHSKK